MHILEFDYELPQELIAQLPCHKREESSMLVLDKDDKLIQHSKFFNIVDCLDENDVLVMNNTRVIPARLFGKKDTGAKIETFLLKQIDEQHWQALIKPSKRVKVGTVIKYSSQLNGEIIEFLDDGKWIVKFNYNGSFYEILNDLGNIPLPPYIERTLTDEKIKELDFERYQTVYANKPGSVAAPTAGLHFTPEILEKLKNKGVQVCEVSLNVGLGTFRPVKAENILDHKMDTEEYEISDQTAQIINDAKANGKSIVAVGTTTVRTLESCYKKFGTVKECNDQSQLFIYPGYEFKVVDKLITNFHLPKSTLLMLVSALAGKDFIFSAYNEAIKNNYRFYSYGDCMLIK